MRPLTTIRALGLLAAGATLIAACNGGAATAAPTTAPVPTTAPGTTAPQPTAVPGETMDLGSGFHGDVDLEAALPKTVGGEAIIALSMTGDQFLGQGSTSPELTAALAALNKTPADLSVAFGASSTLTIVAFRVKGVPGDVLLNAFKEAQEGETTTVNESYSGKNVVKITSNTSPAWIYVKGDIMFAVGAPGATPPTAEQLTEAFAALP